MHVPVPNSLPAFGFLTVVEDDRHGFFGGYLVLSELGRPLEFHCSTPILPSTAQKILYGSTLRSYVLGELIGPALIEKSQVPVRAVLTDVEAMLSLGLVWDGVLAWVSPADGVVSGERVPRETSAVRPPAEADSPELDLAEYQLVGSSTCTWKPAVLRDSLAPLLSYVDLAEPFLRIREAINEAQQVTQHDDSPGEDDATIAAA